MADADGKVRFLSVSAVAEARSVSGDDVSGAVADDVSECSAAG